VQGKAEVVQRALEVQSLPGALPVQLVQPSSGEGGGQAGGHTSLAAFLCLNRCPCLCLPLSETLPWVPALAPARRQPSK